MTCQIIDRALHFWIVRRHSPSGSAAAAMGAGAKMTASSCGGGEDGPLPGPASAGDEPPSLVLPPVLLFRFSKLGVSDPCRLPRTLLLRSRSREPRRDVLPASEREDRNDAAAAALRTTSARRFPPALDAAVSRGWSGNRRPLAPPEVRCGAIATGPNNLCASLCSIASSDVASVLLRSAATSPCSGVYACTCHWAAAAAAARRRSSSAASAAFRASC